MNKRLKSIVLALFILCTALPDGIKAYAAEQYETAETSLVDEAALSDGSAETAEVVDGITLEYDSTSTEYTKLVHVRYNASKFTKGISRFKIILRILGGSVASVDYKTEFSSRFRINGSYSGGIYTISGSSSSAEVPGDGCLFTAVLNLSDALTAPIAISITGDTYLGDPTTAYYLSNGGLSDASTEIPIMSGQAGWTTDTSGTIGNVVWAYSKNTLTLSGEGNMPDFTAGTAPWYKNGKNLIKHIVFTDNSNIVSVGAYAFYGLSALEDVTFVDKINTVGRNSFEGCSSLKELNIPTNMHAGIGEEAFKDCVSINEIFIPNGMLAVSKGAFKGCTGLNKITMPFIGSQVGTSNNTNTFVYLFDGYVPMSLKTVVITNETDIPAEAFKGCSGITSITINPEIKTVGVSAFDGCSSLGTFNIPDGVSVINDNTFRNCSSIRSITVPDTVRAIGEGAFDGCASLGSIHIPESVTEIKNYTFRGCASLTEIKIPSGVTSIGEETLKGCSRLTSIVIPFVGASYRPGLSEITHAGVFGYLFGKSTSQTATRQGNDSYEIPTSVTKVVITNIDSRAYIPPGAFINCSNIADIIIDGGATVCAEAFKNCRNLKNLYIPKSIDEIQRDILYGCTSLVTLTVPFVGNSRTDLNHETSVLGYFFGFGDNRENETDIIQYYNENDFHYYFVPESLKNVSVLNKTNIPYGTFMNCRYLERVSIVSGAVINAHAFYNCVSLKQVSLPSNLTEIGYETFAECAALETINLPAVRNLKLGDYAFYNCTGLRNITIPPNVKSISESAFIGSAIGAADTAEAAASDVLTIYCESGSYAEEYAKANGIKYEIAQKGELNIIKTMTSVSRLSDGAYLFDVTDSNLMSGTVFAALYDKNGALISAQCAPAEAAADARFIFSAEDYQNAAEAKAFIWSGTDTITPKTTEAEIIELR